MSAPDGFRLSAADEAPHRPDAAANYNESVYANAFDHRQRVGGWLRLGNRVHEGRAELSVCLYLPDGSVAVRFDRPAISSNEAFDAGGLRFSVLEPLRRVAVRYRGPLTLLADPAALGDPRTAFASGRQVEAELDWQLDSTSSPHGGEPVDDSVATAYGRDFSRGHYHLHARVRGTVELGGRRQDFDGHGWRDHSWGPRTWQNLFAHRLLTVSFEDGAGLTLHKIEDRDGAVRRLGTVLLGGRSEPVQDLELSIHWDAARLPTGATVAFRTGSRREVVEARVLSLAPLRSRRTVDGQEQVSRILEAAADFTWGPRRGLGMFELVERLEGGQPVGYPL